MSSELATQRERPPVARACALIQSPEGQAKIKQALPAGVSLDRFTRVALTALQQNADIANCEPNSIFLAVSKCAADGLMPDGKQAAIVRFGGVAQYLPMIGGLRYIAAKHGIALATGVVHKNDAFEYTLGIDSAMTHKPGPLDQPRGDAIGAWAQARDKDGNTYLEVMGREDIEKVRAVSRAKASGPWVAQWGEMARKTVGRRLFKSLPMGDLDERDARVLQAVDDEFDYSQDVQTGPQTVAAVADGPRRPSGLQSVVDRSEARQWPQDEPQTVTAYDASPAGPAMDPQPPAASDEPGVPVTDF